MRNLFFAFVLANLAFAAWHAWFAESPVAGPAPRASTEPGILLATEITAPDIELAEAPTGVPPDVLPDAEVAPRLDAAPAAAGVDASGAAAAPRDGAPAEPALEAADPDGGAPREDSVATLDPNEALAAAAAAPEELTCVSVGPFRELSQAATAGATLRAEGFEPTQRAGEGDIWVGYWVYIEQIPSVGEANEILARLRQNGISDSYVIPDSDSGTLVSLGVFTEITRAGRRREEVRALGLEPTISDRTRRATVYWVDVLLPRDGTLDFELLQPPGRIIRLEQRPCDTVPA